MRWFRALLLATVPAFVASVGSVGCAAPEEEDVGESPDAVVANFAGTGNIDLNKRSRIILVGDSDELGTLPLFAATGRARRYREIYPNDQIVLFTTEDVKDAQVGAVGASILREGGFGADGPKYSDLRRLDSVRLVKALDRFTKIASIDFFGHSSPFGLLLEADGANRTLAAGVPSNASVLADNFDRSANPYVTLNGCNGGATTAGPLSKQWKVPVSGALTGSIFQTLLDDGKFYVFEKNSYPAGLKAATSNDVSFASSQRCSTGNCIRMKPQDSPYYGVWSRQDTGFQYGLNHYKFFCAFDESSEACSKGMAQSLYAFETDVPVDQNSTDDQIKEALADFMCTRSSDPSWFESCRANLFNAVEQDLPFSPMRSANDYTLECSFSGCEQKFRCQYDAAGAPIKKTCVWVSAACGSSQAANACRTKNTKKSTTVTEFKRYLEGHHLLRGE